MMFPHPYTIAVLKEMDRRDALAAAARRRQVAEARSAGGEHRALAELRLRLGGALVGLGTRLGGVPKAQPVDQPINGVAPHPAR